MATKAEELPEAPVGGQGAQEALVILAPFDHELWTGDDGVGHQTQQTRVLSSRSTAEL